MFARSPKLTLFFAFGLLLAMVALAKARSAFEFDTLSASKALRADLRQSAGSLTFDKAKNPNVQDVLAQANEDYQRLLNVLYNAGYYAPSISILLNGTEVSALSPFTNPDMVQDLSIIIDPGPKFSFGALYLTPLPQGSSPNNAFATGKPAHLSALQAAVEQALYEWQNAGHARATVARQTISANHQTERLDAQVTLEPGPSLRFGTITAQGQSRLSSDRLLEIAGLELGTPYAPKTIEKTRDRLNRSGIFRSVDVQIADKITSPDQLNVTIMVREAKPRHFGFGAEVGGIDGLLLSGNWMHRNLFGGGERFKVDTSLANIGGTSHGIDGRLDLSFSRPATFSPDTSLEVTLKGKHEEAADYAFNQTDLGVGFKRVFNADSSGQITLNQIDTWVKELSGRTNYRHWALPIEANLDRRDNRLDARNGGYLGAVVTPFWGGGAAGSGVVATYDGRIYKGLGRKESVVLAARLQGGTIWGTDLESTPRDYLFYSGGGGTVRGQGFESLGVTNLGYKTGGLSYQVASLEARFDMGKNLGLVTFYDFGQVSATKSLSDGQSHSGAGLGLRYKTGFGPVRLDLSQAQSGAQNAGLQIYLGIGQAF
ncbi:MAG TPA: hypothetical protein DCR25_07235 [Rhodobacter sp.]|nr:BamA/TamA family outer membrane protein [Paracoccaceae bacterium]HAQ47098.1 hypothetical protein [Rhodobacter sp.]MDO7656067.1 BamA/TamA family outer membrane protein [Paracoccaceae bacterium]MDO7658392.1 BamA/TamA family outer membrane protein [Paracoccaceae bacterium]MDO7732977.1 BamA/TamA family outer membrane protein [Paracoccaceae bacterium]